VNNCFWLESLAIEKVVAIGIDALHFHSHSVCSCHCRLVGKGCGISSGSNRLSKSAGHAWQGHDIHSKASLVCRFMIDGRYCHKEVGAEVKRCSSSF
jgi:hypothetical protein